MIYLYIVTIVSALPLLRVLQGQWRAPGATADMDAAAPTVASTAALLLLPGGKGKTEHHHHPYPGERDRNEGGRAGREENIQCK